MGIGQQSLDSQVSFSLLTGIEAITVRFPAQVALSLILLVIF
jgi:hypothetical protein